MSGSLYEQFTRNVPRKLLINLRETLDNLLVHESKPRNPRLAEAFRRVGLVETTGRGIDKIYLGQLWYGRPLPDYTRSDQDSVRLSLRGGEASLAFAAFVDEQNKADAALTLDELLALNHLHFERRVDVPTIGRLTQRGEGKLMDRGSPPRWVYYESAPRK